MNHDDLLVAIVLIFFIIAATGAGIFAMWLEHKETMERMKRR